MSKHRAPVGNPLVAVGYLRMSKDDQKLSPAVQRASVEAWARAQGAHVVAWHLDDGVCSVTLVDKRPGLVAALGDLRVHGAGVLVVAKRDRLARDVVLTATIEGLVAGAGAHVVSAAGEGNGEAPADQFMRGVIDCAAQYERALIRARTKAALGALRAQGKRAGCIPYGKRLAADGVHLEPDEREQAVLARVAELHDAGLSVRGIAAQLRSEGIVGRAGPLAPTQVQRFLRALPLTEAA